MNQREFYNNYVRPYLRKDDRPYNRSLFAEALDMAHREGMVTDKQAQNWVYPDNDYFESKTQRNDRKRWSR